MAHSKCTTISNIRFQNFETGSAIDTLFADVLTFDIITPCPVPQKCRDEACRRFDRGHMRHPFEDLERRLIALLRQCLERGRRRGRILKTTEQEDRHTLAMQASCECVPPQHLAQPA